MRKSVASTSSKRKLPQASSGDKDGSGNVARKVAVSSGGEGKRKRARLTPPREEESLISSERLTDGSDPCEVDEEEEVKRMEEEEEEAQDEGEPTVIDEEYVLVHYGLGKMSAKRRAEVTFGGYRMDVVKSGVQKYVRRGEKEKAVWCAVEMDLYSLVAKGRGLQTNLWNRLKIIAMEDVSLAGVSTLIEVDRRLLVLEAERKRRCLANDGTEPTGLAKVAEKRALIEIVWMLAASKHARISSHYNAAFRVPKVFDTLKEEAPEVWEQMQTVQDKAKCPKPEKSYPLTKKERANTKLVSIVERLVYCLEQRWDAGFIVVQNLMDMMNGPDKHRGSTKLVFLAFDLFVWFVKEHPGYVPNDSKAIVLNLIEVMARWCKLMISNKEGPPLSVRTAFLALILSKKVDWHREVELPTHLKSDQDVEQVYKKNLKREAMEIDSYVVDMHTRPGRSAGKGREVFALEGSVVTNEDEELVDPLYKKLYILSKGVSLDEMDTERNDESEKSDESYDNKEKQKRKEDEVEAEPEAEAKRERAEEDAEANEDEDSEDEEGEEESQRESEMFESIARAQLVTSQAKQDTYFAKVKHESGLGPFKKDQRVFVKGPFARTGALQAELAVDFNSIKKLLDGLNAQTMCSINLVPDLQLDSFPQPIGYRIKAAASGPRKAFPFLVCDDLFSLGATEESEAMPTRTRTSKLWPATQVPDFDRMAREGLLCTALPSQLAKCERQEDEEYRALDQFILALCFRHIFQIPDSAARNFMWVPKTRQVFSVDEDSTFLGKGVACQNGDKLVSKGSELAVIRAYLRKPKNVKRLTDVLKKWQRQLDSDEGQALLSRIPQAKANVSRNLGRLISGLPAVFGVK